MGKASIALFNAMVASFVPMVLCATIFVSYLILHAAYYSYVAVSHVTSLVGKASEGQLKANGSSIFASNTVWHNYPSLKIKQLPLINLNSTHCYSIDGYECYEIVKVAYWLNGSAEIPLRSKCDKTNCIVTATVELSSDKGLPFELKEKELAPLPKACPAAGAQAELEFQHPVHLVATFWYTQILVQLSFAAKVPQGSQQHPKVHIAALPLLDHTCQPQFIYGFDTKEGGNSNYNPWAFY